ncbi:hypothetical protein [Salinispora vitiensis]|uniref:hypothetical protein n=1 Tax=Salinispora vitiensis TaxID=999544 RepID=UPI0003783109|nr:hypothetical protein [Salinispora vitiensis]
MTWQSGMFLTPARLGGATCVMATHEAVSIPNAFYTKVALPVEVEDSGGMADPAEGRIFCRRAGLYRVSAAVGFSLNSVGSRALAVYRFSSPSGIGTAVPATPSGISARLSASGLIRLAVGHHLEVFVWQNSGGALNLYNQFGVAARLDVEWVSQ